MENALNLVSAPPLAPPSGRHISTAVLRANAPVLGALAALYVLWGSTYFAIRVSLESYPPLLMGGIRFLVAGGVLYVALRRRGAPVPDRRQWLGAVVVGGFLLCGSNGLVILAERTASSSLTAVAMASMPLWTALFSCFVGRRPAALEWAGLLIGFGGVVLLNAGGALDAGGAGLLLLLAPISWAFGSVLSGRLPLPGGAMAGAAQMIAGGVAMLAIGLGRGERLAHLPTARATFAVGYLVVCGSLVGFTAYGYLLRKARPAVATSYAYVNPVVALAIGLVLGGETVTARTAYAAAVILTGGVLLSAARLLTPTAA
jgi:drug/metabolite transporter (DMT)-like permease